MRPEVRVRRLIITADDFGSSPAVNRAVARAARAGVLSAASLMVGGAHAAEAVEIAKSLPSLAVGLHLVLTDGTATLPAAQLPGLVEAGGRFRHGMVYDAFRYALSPRLRAEAQREIRAQFLAFRATGLPLDHVNAHKHFHLHPLLLRLVLDTGREFGLGAVRVPAEPWGFVARCGPAALAHRVLLAPWLVHLRRELARRGIAHNDWVYGLSGSGRFDAALMKRVLAQLPSGVTEIYVHPSERAADGAGHASPADLAALLSTEVGDLIGALGVRACGFSEPA
ncbi:MAG: hopanoid biosynthesis-associated protein HpnK [Proteobacteria bacterium]|nr:hopanoid biosynthesis-associated protein HpnK [Pseudomonadota bacterium]